MKSRAEAAEKMCSWAHSTKAEWKTIRPNRAQILQAAEHGPAELGRFVKRLWGMGEPHVKRLMRQCPLLRHHATRSLHYPTDDIRGARAKPSTILLARHAKQDFWCRAHPG